MSSAPIVVVGAGPSGLMQALYLAQVRRRRVVIVEQQPAAGGMFKSVQTPFGLVDQGIHIPQETGNAVLDGLLSGILPDEEWHFLRGTRRDIAGNFFRNRIDTGSLFPDLRKLAAEDYVRALGEILVRVRGLPPGPAEVPHLGAFLDARFGPHLVDLVYRPLAQKFWKQPLEKLSAWSARVVHMARVVTHDPDVALSLKSAPPLDAVIGFPDQMRVPASTAAMGRNCLYPKRWGTSGIVDGLCHALAKAGAEMLTATKITRLEREAGRIAAIDLAGPGGATQRFEVASLLWTSPLPILSSLLGLPTAPPPDPPLPHRVVHLFLDRQPATGPVYYLWSYDPDNAIIRVSNPAAYCPDAGSSGTYPFCVEMHVPDAKIEDAAAVALAEQECRRLQLIDPATKVAGGSVLAGVRGFFPPTLANCDAQASQRQGIQASAIENLALSCQDIGAGVFYLPDILNASLPLLDSL